MSLNSEQLLKNYQQVVERIENYSRSSSDAPHPKLLAVSKTKPSWMISELYHAGQRDFGENYLQDAIEKILELKNLPDIHWHFIGQVQSNKTSTIAQHFDWVHSVDRLKIAQRLSKQRPDDLPALNICLQVNLDNETQKGGIAPSDTLSLAKEVAQLDNITLRGLMCIPKARETFEQQQQCFSELKQLQKTLSLEGIELDTLSMGMSKDMDAAIAAGSTMLRIGSDIFGARA